MVRTIISYAFYFGVMIVCWQLARSAEFHNNKKCVWAIVIILTLVSGLRAPSVGIDTYSYVQKFEYIIRGQLQYAYGFELSFKYICYIFLKIIPSISALMTALSFITNGLIIWRMWDFRSISAFGTMVGCYYMAHFFMSLNGVRQFCAIAILFYFSRYLVKHQYVKYMVGVLIALLFHKSALIGIVFLTFGLTRWKELKMGGKVFFLGVSVASPFIGYLTMVTLARFGDYFDKVVSDFGIMVPIKMLFFLFSVLFVFVLYGKSNHFANWDELSMESKNNVRIAFIFYAIGLVMLFISYIFPVMNRIGWYFAIFEGCFVGMMVRTKNQFHRHVFGICTIVIVGYGFITAMVGNEQGTMPYLFAWQ